MCGVAERRGAAVPGGCAASRAVKEPADGGGAEEAEEAEGERSCRRSSSRARGGVAEENPAECADGEGAAAGAGVLRGAGGGGGRDWGSGHPAEARASGERADAVPV